MDPAEIRYFIPLGFRLIFTVRNSSCGKAMFSQASVNRYGGEVHPPTDNPLGRQPPWANTRPRSLQRMVRILLKCIHVVFQGSLRKHLFWQSPERPVNMKHVRSIYFLYRVNRFHTSLSFRLLTTVYLTVINIIRRPARKYPVTVPFDALNEAWKVKYFLTGLIFLVWSIWSKSEETETNTFHY